MQGTKQKKKRDNTKIWSGFRHGLFHWRGRRKIHRQMKAEVLGMLLERFDVKKYERSLREEGREEERDRMNKLISILLDQERIEDLNRATKDSEYLEQLFQEFGL